LETIRAEQTKAINDGDGETFARLEKDKDDLISKKPEVVEVQSPAQPNTEENPEYKAWLVDNPWYEDNDKLKDYADSVVYGVSQMTGFKGSKLLDEVKSRAKKMFPEEFENPNRQDAAAVSSGTAQGSAPPTGDDGYSDLPADVKAICEQHVADELGTRKEWMEMYNEA